MSDAGSGPDWHEIAGDPVFEMELDDAHPGEVEGSTGAGASAEGLDSAYSTARRQWIIGDDVAPEGVLVAAVTELQRLGVDPRSLICDGPEVSLLGDKSGTIGGLEVLIDVVLSGTLEPHDSNEPSTIDLELSTQGEEATRSTVDSEAQPDPRVEGNCPPAVLAALGQ